jgi:hypothetical protein
MLEKPAVVAELERRRAEHEAAEGQEIAAEVDRERVPYPLAVAGPEALVESGAALDLSAVARCLRRDRNGVEWGFGAPILVTTAAASRLPKDPDDLVGFLSGCLRECEGRGFYGGGFGRNGALQPHDRYQSLRAGHPTMSENLVMQATPTRTGGLFWLLHTTNENPVWLPPWQPRPANICAQFK